ncbi:hypothetical protein [Mycolicibacterium neoaurum]|uniref:hypothetical protein n=1 Tax=Mycolicibacterium neoaurum TaxID=1795 RepID=UPI0027DEFF48|nr:hypothetical protein [Mycolicibacterium neoaurum]
MTVQFDIDILAQSSIVHRADYTAIGTDSFALFRREKVITATGEVREVPIISGSNFRGILRRIGESLTAAALDYDDEDIALPLPAAHLLTNGGRAAKSARPPDRRAGAPPQVPAAADRRIRRSGVKPHHVWAAHSRQGPS